LESKPTTSTTNWWIEATSHKSFENATKTDIQEFLENIQHGSYQVIKAAFKNFNGSQMLDFTTEQISKLIQEWIEDQKLNQNQKLKLIEDTKGLHVALFNTIQKFNPKQKEQEKVESKQILLIIHF